MATWALERQFTPTMSAVDKDRRYVPGPPSVAQSLERRVQRADFDAQQGWSARCRAWFGADRNHGPFFKTEFPFTVRHAVFAFVHHERADFRIRVQPLKRRRVAGKMHCSLINHVLMRTTVDRVSGRKSGNAANKRSFGRECGPFCES
jgi:hypothetical protein